MQAANSKCLNNFVNKKDVDLAIKVKSLFLSYSHPFTHQEINILDNINFEVPKGELFAIIGPSGCGKTSLLRAICNLIKPKSGYIYINDATLDEARKKRWIGLVDQDSTLLPNRTVFQNISLPCEIEKNCDKSDIEWALELVGLQEYRDRYPYQLSGGMKQRVAIARALVLKPKVLLLDEPFSALDEMLRERMNIEFAQLQRNLNQTAVFITHSIEEAVYLADKIIIMDGKPARIKHIVQLSHLDRKKDDIRSSKEFFEAMIEVRRKVLSV